MKNHLKKNITAGTLALLCLCNTSFGAIAVSADWKTENGNKYYTEGSKRVKGFKEIDGKTYFFDEDGYMVTGWLTYKGKKYYFGSDGVMKTGWHRLKSGTRYYFGDDGAMLTGLNTISGKKYYFDKNGKVKTGWVKINGAKYYFKNSGVMAANCNITIDGKKYSFDEKGRSTLRSKNTANTEPAEFVQPEFGASSKKVLKECGIANPVKLKGDNGKVVYTGTALMDGDEYIYNLLFNSYDELYAYMWSIPASEDEYNEMIKAFKETYGTMYTFTYMEGVPTWYFTDTFFFQIEYSNGVVYFTFADMAYVR